MKESEYIRATNRVKLSMALRILGDVSPGEHYGITDKILSELRKSLAEAEQKLLAYYD